MVDGRPVVVITGGSGFVGHALVDQLLAGDVLAPAEVRILDLGPSEQAGRDGVTWVQTDVRDLAAVRAGVRGADLVLHLAGVVDWGRVPLSTLREVHVHGTQNVVDACALEGVPALVHASSVDVIWSGRPIVAGDESLPVSESHANGYCVTKIEAEQVVLRANGAALASPDPGARERLHCAVIRPMAVWGERDPYVVPSMLSLSLARWVPRVGRREARNPFVYVGNAAHLLLLAGRALLEDPPRGAGEVFFATDFDGINVFDLLRPVIEAAGYRMAPRWTSLPRHPLRELAAIAEAATAVLRPVVRLTPILTRYSIDYVTLDCTIHTDKAARELGYTPRFTREEATARTAAWFRDHR